VRCLNGHLVSERDGSPDLVANAVRLLAEMEQACGRMEAEYAAGQERLSEAAVDEAHPPARRRKAHARSASIKRPADFTR
jgi:hypothetical protein